MKQYVKYLSCFLFVQCMSSFKIRTITLGIPLSLENTRDGEDFNQILTNAIITGKKLANNFEKEGIEVQSVRVSTPSFERWLLEPDISEENILRKIKLLDDCLETNDIGFCSIGPAQSNRAIEMLPMILERFERLSGSVEVGVDAHGIVDREAAAGAADVMIRLAKTTKGGLGNFRFCASFCCPPGIPFFPAAYADDTGITLTVGLENGDLAMKAFANADNLGDARDNLFQEIAQVASGIEKIAEESCARSGVIYGGLDTSLNPALDGEGSIAGAIELLLKDQFGSCGTLEVAAMITSVLKSIPTKKAGYCGLMLPPMEDLVLAQRAAAQTPTYTIKDLLSYSSVCGVGLDTVPVPGNITSKKATTLICDVGALAHKWNKPLSCRLFPVPNQLETQETMFSSPYMCNTKVFTV